LAYFRKGETDQAIAQYRMALESKPGDPATHYNLGLAFFAKGETDEAIAQYRKALESQPDSAETQFTANTRATLGSALFTKGQTDEAIAQYRKALESAPDNAEARNNLGIALSTKGELDEAVTQYRKALEINPNQVYVLNNLAWLLATTPDASLRNGAKALALAAQANQLSGNANPTVLHTLAAAYAETGNYGQAAATARRGLELALAQKNDTLAATLQKEIKLYETGAPVRDASR
jgi:Flp pilus assembly protein TadD